jgi:hypothetical protein
LADLRFLFPNYIFPKIEGCGGRCLAPPLPRRLCTSSAFELYAIATGRYAYIGLSSTRKVNDELERIWKHAVVGKLQTFFLDFLGGTEENFGQYNVSAVRGSSLRPPEKEGGGPSPNRNKTFRGTKFYLDLRCNAV